MGLSLAERDKNIIWHPYTPQKYNPDPIPIIKGEGSWLIDENGNRYLDAISSWWVTVHGHAHPYIASRIYEQALKLEQVIFAGFTHEPAVSLAERLIKILPGSFSRIFYSDNGSTATEVAIKMALQYWSNLGQSRRKKVIALNHSYHGDTFGAMSISERGIFTRVFNDKLFDVEFIEVSEEADFADLDTNMLDSAACIIYEPLIQGSGGMKMHSPATLQRLLTRCRQHGVLCIADEVMTGFGRTGKLFASSHTDVEPDIICLSKGITGGTMALGVTACTASIHEAFISDDKLKTFFHGHSFTANPIACTAALASLDLFEQGDVLDRIAMIEARNITFAELLRHRQDQLHIANIRTCGTILAFEVNEKENNYISSIKERFTALALSKGVFMRPLGNTVYTMPPYCITDDELDMLFRVIVGILEEMQLQ